MTRSGHLSSTTHYANAHTPHTSTRSAGWASYRALARTPAAVHASPRPYNAPAPAPRLVASYPPPTSLAARETVAAREASRHVAAPTILFPPSPAPQNYLFDPRGYVAPAYHAPFFVGDPVLPDPWPPLYRRPHRGYRHDPLHFERRLSNAVFSVVSGVGRVIGGIARFMCNNLLTILTTLFIAYNWRRTR